MSNSAVIWTGFLVVCIGGPIVGLVMDQHDPLVCVDEVTVKEILSVDFRDATILTTDGRQITVNQEKLKPGSPYCVNKEHRSKIQ